MTGDNLYIVRGFGQYFFATGNHPLHAAAAIQVNKGEYSAIEKIVAHVDHLGLGEEDDGVSIRVATGNVNGADVLAVEVDRDIVFKGNDGQSHFFCRRDGAESCLAAFFEPFAHILLRDDRRFCSKMLIASGVVAVPVSV